MRIAMLLDSPFPPDPRVANEARSLVDAGHEVHLVCPELGGRPREETWQGVELRRWPISRFRFKKFGALNLELPFHRMFFKRALEQTIREQDSEAIHVHDLPLLEVGLELGRQYQIPVVADLHENYPAAVENYDYANRFPGRLLISTERWRRYEKRTVPQADRVLVVIEEARERFAGTIPNEKIEVISNTVEVGEFEGFPIDQELVDRLASQMTFVYLGGFDRHRGLETLVEAFDQFRKEQSDAYLVLVGTGATRAALESQCAQLGLSDRVSFEGWQDFRKFPSYVLGSSVCMIPHLRSEHTDTTIPHKLFHYMLLERPVISTDCRPLRRILESTGAGLCYPSGDARALSERFREMRDPKLRAKLGAAGRVAVLDEFNWAQTARRLVAIYDSL